MAARMVQRKSRSAPKIACINAATVELGVDFDRLIPALQSFLDNCFVPIWGTPANLVEAGAAIDGAWTLIFLDDADVANDNSYHQITLNGLPLAKVFVKSTLASHDKVSVAACHELAEMLVDPAVNTWADGPKGSLWAFEVCDAVEEVTFAVDRIPMSNFVYPAYFELFRRKEPGSAQFDYLRKVKEPFELLSGGYSQVRTGRKVKEIFGSKAKKRRFKQEDRRLHRSEFRKKLAGRQ